jgi:hypothetical protein
MENLCCQIGVCVSSIVASNFRLMLTMHNFIHTDHHNQLGSDRFSLITALKALIYNPLRLVN